MLAIVNLALWNSYDHVCCIFQQSLMSFFHTDEGPLEDETERVDRIMDQGLVISWKVSHLPFLVWVCIDHSVLVM